MSQQSEIRLPRPVEPVRVDAAEVREWAAAHGHDVGDRGSLPQEVVDRYVGYRLRARRRLIRQGHRPKT